MSPEEAPAFRRGERVTELRPYQQEAMQAFLSASNPPFHGTLAMSPGSGKTLVAVHIIKVLNVPTIVIVPTKVLIDQWLRVLKREKVEGVKIVTYAWAAMHADDEAFWSSFAFVIGDEMHHLGFGPEFKRILVPIFKAQYALGLSATPPKPKDGEENLSLRVLPVVYTYTFAQGREQGFSADIEIRPVEVQLTEQERKEYTELTEEIHGLILRFGSVDRAVRIAGGVFTKRKQLVALAEAKYAKLKEIVTQVLPETNGRIFCWSEYIDALEKAKATLNADGKQLAELVTGETPKKERRRIIEQAWGRDFPILLTARVAEEGLDAPESEVGLLLAGAKTTRQNVQRLGRLLRPSRPGKKARLYVIFASRTTDERIIPLLDLAVD